MAVLCDSVGVRSLMTYARIPGSRVMHLVWYRIGHTNDSRCFFSLGYPDPIVKVLDGARPVLPCP